MNKLQNLKISRRDAFNLWKTLTVKSVSFNLVGRFFDIAFPLGTNDPLYKRYIEEELKGRYE